MIYLDYQATTPLAPEARAAMLPYLDEKFANPHSPHRLGREAAAAIEVAREQVAALLPAGGRLAFTSGATEALNWAIKGTRGPIVTLATEHAAVLDSVGAVGQAGREVHILPVDGAGLVDFDAARGAIAAGGGAGRPPPLGTIQPVEELATLAHDVGALFLCDAVQGFGRVTIPENCDLVALSGHKIHGPKGIGALWVREGVAIDPLLHGGGQEAPGRSGTVAPMLCAGLGAAAGLMAARQADDAAHVERLWLIATRRLGPEWLINGSCDRRYRGNLNVRREGVDSARLISDLRELAFSAGSACASGSGRPSHVLKAIGLSDRQARSSIRIGFGRYTTEEEIDRAMVMILDAAARQAMWAA